MSQPSAPIYPDSENPAVDRQFRVSPALLEEVGNDPAILTRVSRKMLLIQLSRQHKKLLEADASANVRQAFIEQLAKIGDAVPKTNANQNVGTGFSVSINFSGKSAPNGAPQAQVVITQNAEEPPAEEPLAADDPMTIDMETRVDPPPDPLPDQLPSPEATELPLPEDAKPARGWVMD